MRLTVNTPDELIAAIPHMLGFKPQESIVIVPVTAETGLPCARVNLTPSPVDRDEVLRVVLDAYRPNARPGAALALVCVSDDGVAADGASDHLAAGLRDAGFEIKLRLWSDGERWADFRTGAGGLHTEEVEGRLAAATVLAGARQPADSREAMAESFVGDRAPIGETLKQSRALADPRSPSPDRFWAMRRVSQFNRDGNRLSDADGSRLLLTLKSDATCDAVWEDITRENAHSHAALWTNLTRRAPDEVRAAPAALAGFSWWMAGDGAKAWCALDQIPPGKTSMLASIVSAALQQGLNPDEWQRAATELRRFEDDLVGPVDETHIPDTASQTRRQESPSHEERPIGQADRGNLSNP